MSGGGANGWGMSGSRFYSVAAVACQLSHAAVLARPPTPASDLHHFHRWKSLGRVEMRVDVSCKSSHFISLISLISLIRSRLLPVHVILPMPFHRFFTFNFSPFSLSDILSCLSRNTSSLTSYAHRLSNIIIIIIINWRF